MVQVAHIRVVRDTIVGLVVGVGAGLLLEHEFGKNLEEDPDDGVKSEMGMAPAGALIGVVFANLIGANTTAWRTVYDGHQVATP